MSLTVTSSRYKKARAHVQPRRARRETRSKCSKYSLNQVKQVSFTWSHGTNAHCLLQTSHGGARGSKFERILLCSSYLERNRLAWSPSERTDDRSVCVCGCDARPATFHSPLTCCGTAALTHRAKERSNGPILYSGGHSWRPTLPRSGRKEEIGDWSPKVLPPALRDAPRLLRGVMILCG